MARRKIQTGGFSHYFDFLLFQSNSSTVQWRRVILNLVFFYYYFQIIRQDVYTDMNFVPILRLKKCKSAGPVLQLNAYALDFFKHGSQKVIERENGLVINKIIHRFYFLQKSVKLI